jgi:hypothetical protein
VILKDINPKRITVDRLEIKERIIQILRYIKNTENVNSVGALDFFYALKASMADDYAMKQRKLKLSKEQIHEHIFKQNNICPICGTDLFIGDEAEADHILPLAVGGSDVIDNIQIAHWICNREKGSRVEYED